VLGGTLSIAAVQPLVVAHFRAAFPPGTVGEVAAQEGIARLSSSARTCRQQSLEGEEEQDEWCDRGGGSPQGHGPMGGARVSRAPIHRDSDCVSAGLAHKRWPCTQQSLAKTARYRSGGPDCALIL